MEKKQQYQINFSAPNLVNVCVDKTCDGEMSGKLYHCYAKDAIPFSNVVELIRIVDQLFDSISYPQASTKARSFIEAEEQPRQQRPEKVVRNEELVQYRGALGTFMVFVKFRQNSTWQGEMVWMEQEEKKFFSNTLDLIKLVDYALAVSGT